MSDNYITFSFYYVNNSNEVDKILKNKYKLNNNHLSKEELFNEIVLHKNEYHSNVSLHEILFYENTCDPLHYINDVNPPKCFKKINYNSNLYLSDDFFQNLTRIYVIFKSNLNPTQKKKIPHTSYIRTKKNNLLNNSL